MLGRLLIICFYSRKLDSHHDQTRNFCHNNTNANDFESHLVKLGMPSMDAVVAQPHKPFTTHVRNWWQRQAYLNQAAEWSLYFMFASGLILWELFTLPWAFERLVLISHVIASLIIFPLMVLPFWLSHRRLLKKSQKRLLIITGQLLDLLLLACAASGLFLFLIGNRGDNLGYLAFLIHLISALILAPILMRHAAKWSVLKPLWSLFKH